MFIAANTRRPTIGRRLTEYFEMVFPEILPSVIMAGFPRVSHIIKHISLYIAALLSALK